MLMDTTQTSENKREIIPIFLDEKLKEHIKESHVKTKGFSFQSVGESLFKAWVDQGMPFPVGLDVRRQTESEQLAAAFLEWIRTEHGWQEQELKQFVLKCIARRGDK